MIFANGGEEKHEKCCYFSYSCTAGFPRFRACGPLARQYSGARIFCPLGSFAMPEIALQPTVAPLTTLSEDEVLFRDSVRQFAEDKVRPLAREMDEKGVFDHKLIEEFFQLGLMGIEIPEEYGGAGGKFFEAILAVEELSRADASAGVVVDVQNTLVNNALLRWGN